MDTTEILKKYKNIAVYGASATPGKAAHEIPVFMKKEGYDIYPINPKAQEIAGEIVFRDIMAIPDEIEILDVFRPSEECKRVAELAVERKKAKGDIKVLWLQLGIVSPEAKKIAEDNGIEFVQDKCLKIEYNRMHSK